MKKWWSMALAMFLFLFPVAASADKSMHCGSRIISIGDSKSRVLRYCGSPTWRDRWVEERIERVVGRPYSNGSPYLGTRIPVATIVRVTVEEWGYNRGSSYFIRTLTFENNRLIDIVTGEYGY